MSTKIISLLGMLSFAMTLNCMDPLTAKKNKKTEEDALRRQQILAQIEEQRAQARERAAAGVQGERKKSYSSPTFKGGSSSLRDLRQQEELKQIKNQEDWLNSFESWLKDREVENEQFDKGMIDTVKKEDYHASVQFVRALVRPDTGLTEEIRERAAYLAERVTNYESTTVGQYRCGKKPWPDFSKARTPALASSANAHASNTVNKLLAPGDDERTEGKDDAEAAYERLCKLQENLAATSSRIEAVKSQIRPEIRSGGNWWKRTGFAMTAALMLFAGYKWYKSRAKNGDSKN